VWAAYGLLSRVFSVRGAGGALSGSSAQTGRRSSYRLTHACRMGGAPRRSTSCAHCAGPSRGRRCVSVQAPTLAHPHRPVAAPGPALASSGGDSDTHTTAQRRRQATAYTQRRAVCVSRPWHRVHRHVIEFDLSEPLTHGRQIGSLEDVGAACVTAPRATAPGLRARLCTVCTLSSVEVRASQLRSRLRSTAAAPSSH